jgi:hypothetical protein
MEGTGLGPSPQAGFGSNDVEHSDFSTILSINFVTSVPTQQTPNV